MGFANKKTAPDRIVQPPLVESLYFSLRLETLNLGNSEVRLEGLASWRGVNEDNKKPTLLAHGGGRGGSKTKENKGCVQKTSPTDTPPLEITPTLTNNPNHTCGIHTCRQLAVQFAELVCVTRGKENRVQRGPSMVELVVVYINIRKLVPPPPQ